MAAPAPDFAPGVVTCWVVHTCRGMLTCGITGVLLITRPTSWAVHSPVAKASNRGRVIFFMAISCSSFIKSPV